VANRRLYREKFARVTPVIATALQQDIAIPAGGFYLWLQVGNDEAFTHALFAQQHVTVLPGRYLARETGNGNPGLGRIRMSLVASLEDCDEAARRIADFVRVRECRIAP
jgi:N-succinyldiaminopimelate aminotransferase